MKYFFCLLPLYVLITTFIIFYLSTVKNNLNIVTSISITNKEEKEEEWSDTNVQLSFYENNVTDHQQLIDLTDFKYILNSEPCTSHETIVMIIHSSAGNFDKRMAIRNTWGSNQSFPHKLIFALGLNTNNTIQELIDSESNEYKDIIQGNFIDSYRNLTYKHVMALKWIYYNCNRIKFAIKVDDDVFINVEMFLNTFLLLVPKLNTIICPVNKNAAVKRSWRSKWRVSFKELTLNTYPDYCAGWLIVYTSDTIEKLYLKAQKNKYFWIDDVLITGIYAEKLNINRVPILKKHILSSISPTLWKLKRHHKVIKNFMIGPYDLNALSITKIWSMLQSCK